MSEVDLDDVQYVHLHGHKRAYLKVGSGPAVLLIHGIGSKHETWLPTIAELSKHYTVIAPDLLGHGRSAKPRADYSIGGYANGMRDLLAVLGIERVTVVGHSLGGGIAMQFAYQFPQRTERIVLVGAGGLGPEVNPVIPMCTIPGAGAVLAVATAWPIRVLGDGLMSVLYRTGLPMTADLDQLSVVYDDLRTREARQSFRHVLRAIVDWRGQIVTMRDRAYLAQYVPAMVVWGARDTVIPVAHAYVAHDLLPGSRLEIFPDAGHFPHAEFPEKFAELLMDFIASTTPVRYDGRRWTRALRRGANRPTIEADSGDSEVISIKF